MSNESPEIIDKKKNQSPLFLRWKSTVLSWISEQNLLLVKDISTFFYQQFDFLPEMQAGKNNIN